MNKRYFNNLASNVCKTAFLLLFSLSVNAFDITESMSVHGFMTLDATVTDADKVIFPSQSGPAITLEKGEVNYDNSIIGLQLDFAPTDSLSFFLQAIAHRNTEFVSSPKIEWAYVKYDLGHDLYIRAGEFKIPFLQGTELRNIGYTRLWARPVIPNSGASGFNDYTGIELIKSTTIGGHNVRFQASYGEADHQIDSIDNKEIKLLSARVERNDSWVNIAVVQADYDVYTINLSQQLRNDAELLLGSIEAEFLFNQVIFNAGLIGGEADVLPDQELTYLSLGYQAGNFTPYVLLSNKARTFDKSESGVTPPGPGPGPGPGPPAPGTGPTQLDGKITIKSIALGVRYDFAGNYAIKAQWEYQDTRDATKAIFEEYDANIFSIVLEGVFQ